MCIVTFRWAPESDQPPLLAPIVFFFERGPPSACTGGRATRCSGRDQRSGGAWLGITRHGRFAMVTNIRNPALRKQGAPSRAVPWCGSFWRACSLLRTSPMPRWTGRRTLRRFQPALRRSRRFGPFTVVRQLAGARACRRTRRAWSSNASLDTPAQSFTHETGFRHALAESDPAQRNTRLLRLLQNATPTPDAQLPNTGVPFAVERMLGSIFIVSDNYGTRASTVLSVIGDQVTMREAGFGVGGEPQDTLASPSTSASSHRPHRSKPAARSRAPRRLRQRYALRARTDARGRCPPASARATGAHHVEHRANPAQ